MHTVERHISNVYLKIGARNRAEATAFALQREDRRQEDWRRGDRPRGD